MDKTANLIDELKKKLGVETDVDLARALTVDKSTVSSWRNRGNVPERYLAILKGESHQTVLTPPIKWGQYEEFAFRLALFRFAKAKGLAAQGTSYGEVYMQFNKHAGFWLLMRQAQKDLALKIDDQTGVMDTAFALLIHDDIEAGEAATARDLEILNALKISQV
ncbi:helix-turn-helix domain-containing protein [Pseudorhodobacter ferrugineus]|uniref:helix-turn-helix domain-containing protein n=1 Tax=Pseudorhodobacter ferrugineus TaxID=77008 RepID=UPI0003B314A4|nr:helix-turn-helix domain-containing protein [Pseudorhodobacter ferrugineus]